MKQIIKSLTTAVLVIWICCIQSCRKETDLISNKDSTSTNSKSSLRTTGNEISNNLIDSSGDENMVLGNKLNNPYTLSNMKKAFEVLGSAKAKTLTYNRIYVKLLPQTQEQVLDFLTNENVNRCISEYPVDYEILKEGNIYFDPKVSSDTFIKPYYCVANSIADIPNVPYQILEYGYVPTDLEENVEEMAWKIAGYDLDSINDMTPSSSKIIGKYKYYPEGYVDVLRSPTTQYTPVRNKSLLMTTFFVWSYVRTSSTGYFKSSKKFIVKVPVHIRQWNQEYKIFGHSLWDKIGTATKANSNPNTHYRIGTGDRGAYNKAVLNNTFFDYNDYCNSAQGGQGSIIKLDDIWYWIPITKDRGGTTVLKHKFNFSSSELYYSNVLGTAITNDIALRYWHDNSYQNKQNLMFHEFSHYSHAMKAGRAYWKDVVVSEAENIAYTLTTTKDPYRDGVHPTSGGADQIGLAESWAEFMGAVISTFYYGSGQIFTYTGGFDIENFSPQFTPSMITFADGSQGGWHYGCWIPTGLWWDLWDTNNETNQRTVYGNTVVTDCATYPLPAIYNALAGCVRVTDMRPKIFNLNPNTKCSLTLFNAYGY